MNSVHVAWCTRKSVEVVMLSFSSFNYGSVSYFTDLNAQDNVGNTPLHVAVENESLDAVDYLLTV